MLAYRTEPHDAMAYLQKEYNTHHKRLEGEFAIPVVTNGFLHAANEVNTNHHCLCQCFCNDARIKHACMQHQPLGLHAFTPCPGAPSQCQILGLHVPRRFETPSPWFQHFYCVSGLVPFWNFFSVLSRCTLGFGAAVLLPQESVQLPARAVSAQASPGPHRSTGLSLKDSWGFTSSFLSSPQEG